MKGLLQLLEDREKTGNPLRVGLIGAGKFGSMFLSQARRVPGLHVMGIADLSLEKARESLLRIGWPQEQFSAKGFDRALKTGSTCLTDDSGALIKAEGLDVLVEATGDPAAGIRHALAAFESGKHVVQVSVEADALAGSLLAQKAEVAGVVYSMAYGDQPALICELVEWARVNGFDVVCAGKGTKYLPIYNRSTPEKVWEHYGFDSETVAKGGFNPQMFNSFLDGTKSAIEMAAVANATDLVPQSDGLGFPPCSAEDLPNVCRPEADGGRLSHKGTVEVVSCLDRDGRPVEPDFRWGVYVTFEAPSEYVKRCFVEYGMNTDTTGRYAAMYRPYHIVGLELTFGILKVGLREEATGTPTGFTADVVARAKRDLQAGEVLDGEGGYRVYGVLARSEEAMKVGGLPIGLARGVKLKRGIVKDQMVRWSDVHYDEKDPTVCFRREMEGERK